MVGYDCIFCVGKEKDYTTQQIVVAIYEDQWTKLGWSIIELEWLVMPTDFVYILYRKRKEKARDLKGIWVI
jgi:hypothetical protein